MNIVARQLEWTGQRLRQRECEVREYECWSCGEYKPMTDENEGTFEGDPALYCNECKKKGRHQLRP